MAHLIAARYGAMNNIGNFVSESNEFRLHDKVILQTDRGMDVGEVISSPEYIMRGTDVSSFGRVIRKMDQRDVEAVRHIEEELAPAEIKFCEDLIRKNRISMKLATVEHLFGGEKIIFYFLAEGRVDFRQLVKDLAAEYRTRIEMRQIGVRDEARLLAEYEHCGQPLCCKRFMRDLQPVTMRMAKSQKTTLDPAKISGRCGRLMCCLRFEDETYIALKKNLPRRGDHVVSEAATGRVVGQNVLKQLVTIEIEDGTEVEVHVDDIRQVEKQEKNRKSGNKGPRDSKGLKPPQGSPKPPDSGEPQAGRNPRQKGNDQ
ncbi:MAG: signal peptidase [Planctomycetes bacterium]|nr:signal peptidase [Planctomycetota bacterium]